MSEDLSPEPDLVADAATVDALARQVEALLLASDSPVALTQLQALLGLEPGGPSRKLLREALAALQTRLVHSAAEVLEVAEGWRLQVRAEHASLVSQLWAERPPRLTRAVLETLAIILYRQPVTRGDIEDIRGVAVAPTVIKALLDRGWIAELGQRESPGRPALFGTTPRLLSDLGVKSLTQLPELPAVKDLGQLEAALARLGPAAVEATDNPTPTLH